MRQRGGSGLPGPDKTLIGTAWEKKNWEDVHLNTTIDSTPPASLCFGSPLKLQHHA